MPAHNQLMDIHGFGRVVWWHASVPTKVWEDLTQGKDGCWLSKGGMQRVLRNRRLMLLRVGDRNPAEALAITPTCGDGRCCNPQHLCVVMETSLSYAERGA